MECARCGGDLDSYALNGKEAFVCPDCGFADTPVEHDEPKRDPPESWSEALERFKQKQAE